MIIDFIIEDLLLDSYLQKNFHTPHISIDIVVPGMIPFFEADVNLRGRKFFCVFKNGSSIQLELDM